MRSTPWGEDPRTFWEPVCLECGAITTYACKCNGEQEFSLTYDPALKDLPF